MSPLSIIIHHHARRIMLLLLCIYLFNLMLVVEILRVNLHLQADFGKGCIDSGSLDSWAICNRGLNHHHNSAKQNQVSQSGKMIIQPTFLLSSVLVNNSPAPVDLLTADWMKY